MAFRLNKGILEIYTGNGKGKTTAAFGLAFRAVGWGLRVYIVQFMKLGTYGENRSSRKFGENLRVNYAGMPYFIAWEDDIPLEDRKKVKNVVLCPKGQPPEDYRKKVQQTFEQMKEDVGSGDWDIVIMDEVNVAIYYNLLELDDLLNFLDSRGNNVEVVLTGRKMPQEVLERASLITEMKEIKHPYSDGMPARRGVDF